MGEERVRERAGGEGGGLVGGEGIRGEAWKNVVSSWYSSLELPSLFPTPARWCGRG